VRASKFAFPPIESEFSLIEPTAPKIATHFVHPFHPMKILHVLKGLKVAFHKQREIAHSNHLSESDVAVIAASAIEIAKQYLSFTKKGRQQIADISSVDGALSALHIDLHAADRSKYKNMRVGLSVPLTIPPDFAASWMRSREVIKIPEPTIYLFVHPSTLFQPLLSLIKSAGMESADLVVKVPTKAGFELEVAIMKSEIAFEFQGVYGEVPEYRPVKYHTARSKPYLTIPGIDVPIGKDSPVHAEVGGLDALLFCCAVFARSLEIKNGTA
jgi:hypothetical protein